MEPWRALAQMPLRSRSALIGAICAGLMGAVVGLVVGLYTYPPTAWFAVIEVGLPATLAGAVVGPATASIVLISRRLRR